QFLSFLRVSLQVPFIGPLGLDDATPGLLAEPLGSREIGMAGARDVARGELRHGNASHQHYQHETTGNGPPLHRHLLLYAWHDMTAGTGRVAALAAGDS